MVKPAGTGRPMRHISARFAPLPPSSGFIVPLPSVFLPNKYTNLPDAFAVATGFAALAARGGDAFFLPAVFFSAILAACFFAIEFGLLIRLRGSTGARRSTLVVGHHL